jgi:hypothetical protein
LIVIKSNCNRNANKSNHPLQNPLLLVMETLTRDNIFTVYHRKIQKLICMESGGLECMQFILLHLDNCYNYGCREKRNMLYAQYTFFICVTLFETVNSYCEPTGQVQHTCIKTATAKDMGSMLRTVDPRTSNGLMFKQLEI